MIFILTITFFLEELDTTSHFYSQFLLKIFKSIRKISILSFVMLFPHIYFTTKTIYCFICLALLIKPFVFFKKNLFIKEKKFIKITIQKDRGEIQRKITNVRLSQRHHID